MKKKTNTHSLRREMDTLADDARSLLAATAGVVDEKVVEARKRLASALANGQGLYRSLRRSVTRGARAADKTLSSHPYANIGVAFGTGALLGMALRRHG